MKSRKCIKSSRVNTTKKKSIKSRRKINKSNNASRITKSKAKSIRKSKLKTSRKSRMNRTTKKTVKKSTKNSLRDDFCKTLLKDKIAYNMNEYKSGRWKSRKQALAVSYSQMRRNSKCSSLKR
jgi:hypothetical protein